MTIMLILAAALLLPSISKADLGEGLNYSMVDIEWMSSSEVADLLEFSIKENKFAFDTAYLILRSLSDQKISGILKNLSNLDLKDYFISELACESHLRTARVLLKLDDEIASPLLKKLDEQEQNKIMEIIKEFDPEYYENLISFAKMELALK